MTKTNEHDPAPLISPRELALRWDCSRTSAQRIARRAGLSRVLLGEGKNGIVRYVLSEVQRYEASRTEPASSE